ncbi:MAG: CHAT domain-containing protein [Nitrosomonas sp.]|uniref:CHAT domain-containing protein n=1 Tax=Nitrosomonas sp. TaxID=42353 RepID=UPI0032ED1F46
MKKLITFRHFFLSGFFLFILISCTTLNNPAEEGSVDKFYQLGEESFKKGLFVEARTLWRTGLNSSKKDSESYAYFLNGLARIAENTGNYQEAVHLAEQTLNIAKALADKRIEGNAHAIIGQTYRRLDDYPKAKHYSESAMKIAQQIGDPVLESDSSRNLGAIYQAQGQLDSAAKMYQHALTLAQQANDKWLQAKALNNLGELSQRNERLVDAITLYQQSLQLRESIDDLAGQGSVSGNICRIYQDLNDYAQALNYCKKALSLSRQAGDKAREANHLNNIAGIFFDLEKFSDAKEYFYRSISIKQSLRDLDGIARGLNNIGLIHRYEGKNEEALEYFQKSLKIKEQQGDRTGQSATYLNIGAIYFDSGKYNEALTYLKQALAIQTALKEPRLLWQIYNQLSNVYHKLGYPNFAIYLGKLSVNSIQSIRISNKELGKSLLKSYMEDKKIAYERLTNLLIEKGRLSEAQQVQTMFKEEEYYDFILRDAHADSRTTKANLQPEETEWQNEYQKIDSEIVKSGKEMHELKQKGSGKTREDEERLIELDNKLSLAEKNFNEVLDKLANASNHDIEERSLENNLTGLVSDLGNDAALLQMVTRNENMWILLTTTETRKPYKIEVNQATLNQHIYALRTALIDPNQDPRPAGKVLFDLLLTPLMNDLKTINAKTLMLSLDGALRYIPFAALFDGEHYLIELFALSIFNDAIQQNMKDHPNPNWRAVGLGNSKEYPDFGALPGVPIELKNIVKQNDKDKTGILPGKILLDQEFDQKQFRLALLDEYPVVHIASHFALKPGTEKNSFLLLGDGSHLSLSDIRRGNFNFKGVDLLTLSACNTATTSESSDGKEVEGFAVLAQQKGAKGVLASLWSVSDSSTSILMQNIYRLHTESNLTKAEALREAQLILLRGSESSDDSHESGRGTGLLGTKEKPKSYTHPFYWAPFILMGNWL